MEIFSKIGTLTSYVLCFITWNIVTQVLAAMLTVMMILFYYQKWRNEKLESKLKKRKLKSKDHA